MVKVPSFVVAVVTHESSEGYKVFVPYDEDEDISEEDLDRADTIHLGRCKVYEAGIRGNYRRYCVTNKSGRAVVVTVKE